MFDAIAPSLPILAISLGIVVVLVVIKAFFEKKTTNQLPYKVKKSILTAYEQRYFEKLQLQYESTHHIFCQVALNRILSTTAHKNYQTYQNKINQKSIDFVLVDKQTMQTTKLIELNDKTHKYKKRMERDEFLKQVCEDANIELDFV